MGQPGALLKDGGAFMGESVLVLEDDAAIRHVLSTLLESEGYRVVPATSGRKALKLMGERTPELVLLDLRLPDMSGATFLKQLGGDRPPVLLLTGNYGDPEGADCIAQQHGVEACILKPFV